MATNPLPANPSPAKTSRVFMLFGFLKYLVPVAASVLSIYLHNQQTVAKIQKTADVLTPILPEPQP